MGTVIKNTAIVSDNGFSSLENSTLAGKRCIETSGVCPSEIGALIYTGVYRDDNVMEPSIACLIQKQLALGLDVELSHQASQKSDKSASHAPVFSFDIVNGACGLLNAFKVADALLKNGTARTVLIVSGDCHPSKRERVDFPFVATGGAVLLQWDNHPDRGFVANSYITDPNNESSINAFGDLSEFGENGRENATVLMDQDYQEHFFELALTHINQFTGLNRISMDYLLTNEVVEGFASQLCYASDLCADCKPVAIFSEFGGDIHTSSLIAAYESLQKRGILEPGKQLLFSAVGSGNAAACAHYVV
ncbi:MAG: hypothetical protein MI976_16030 [Pseudomonadales bacterium]|nr:hypothetical protein [Pseudomonadales bacterium]